MSEPIANEGRRSVAIVGGGFAGTMLAVQLARLGIGSFLIEGSGRLGKGTAYSTREPAHLLNLPAHRMSAFADDPDHFVRRFETIGGDRDSFAERRFFGRYLTDILGEAIASGAVAPVEGEAVGAQFADGGWHVQLDDGRTLETDALALAIGNEAPAEMAALDGLGPRYVANPWRDAAAGIERVAEEGGDVLIIGTGLTMVDTVLSLDEAGFAGRITALSRRGLSPRAHAPHDPAPIERGELPDSPIGLLRWLRRRSADVGWRAAVDSIRPHSHGLWQGFSPEQRKRFLRHARPYWDVHRHRIAPQIAGRIASLIAEDRLEILGGRVIAARDEAEGIRVSILRRGSSEPAERSYALIINCTGPLHGMSRTINPLLRSLLDAGLAQPDTIDIGLDVDDQARVSGANRLWAMGALTKGRYWEMIAVPDIRGQAAMIAEGIAEELTNG